MTRLAGKRVLIAEEDHSIIAMHLAHELAALASIPHGLTEDLLALAPDSTGPRSWGSSTKVLQSPKRQPAALFLVELWYSWRYRHTCITN
jgi:hypothetical protein